MTCQVRAIAFALISSTFTSSAAAQQAKASFDCTKAATQIEKTICRDSKLASRDVTLSRLYTETKRHSTNTVQQKLTASQRDWLKKRESECPQTDSGCLVLMYDGRISALRAALATTSAANPDIPDATPATLAGTWEVEKCSKDSTDTNLRPDSLFVPHSGDKLLASDSRLCANVISDNTCNRFGLAVTTAPNSIAQEARSKLSIENSAPFLLTYFSGKAEFGLIRRSDGTLVLPFSACDAAGDHCTTQFQCWRPASPDAKLTIYDLFSSKK